MQLSFPGDLAKTVVALDLKQAGAAGPENTGSPRVPPKPKNTTSGETDPVQSHRVTEKVLIISNWS